MNVLNNLVELYNQLPLDSTYRVVAKGILDHLPELADATIYDIAALTNSSRTTVWRMVQKMGYQTFSEFRHALKNAVQQYSYYNCVLQLGQASDCAQLVQCTASQLHNVADLMQQFIHPEEICALAERMHASNRIGIYLPLHLFEPTSLQQNLAMDGKETGYFCLLPEMLVDANTLDEHSLVLAYALEYSETLDLSPVLTAARAHNAEIWLVKGQGSRYRSLADHTILDTPPNLRGWTNLFENFLLILSEWYRRCYVDIPQHGIKFET